MEGAGGGLGGGGMAVKLGLTQGWHVSSSSHGMHVSSSSHGGGYMPVKLGLLLTAVNDMVEVTKVQADGSAAREGQVQRGDVIVSVDGLPVQGLSVGEVTARIRGDAACNGLPV